MKKLWLALLPLPALGASPQYTVRDLGPTRQPGGTLYWSMNESIPADSLPSLGGDPALCNVSHDYLPDLAVGDCPFGPPNASYLPATRHAVFWWNQAITDLGVLPGAFSTEDSHTGAPGFGPDSTAYAANDVQEIVGASDAATQSILNYRGPSRHAVLWTNVRSSTRSIHDLGALAGDGYNSLAQGVNDSHEIVGWTNTIATADGSVLQRAFLYTAGTMYNLSFYLANASNIRLTEALSINCQGDIAAIGYDLNRADAYNPRSYLLIRQGTSRTCP